MFYRLQGKVEMEIELLTEDEARERPAGRARDEPNQHPTLEPPKYDNVQSTGYAELYRFIDCHSVQLNFLC